MRHSLTVDGFDGTLKELATEIANLRYDSMAKLLSYILFDLERQSSNDKIIGRSKLSDIINKSCLHISQAIGCVQEAWVLSEPRIKEVEKRI
jgi:hypothetical protein